MRASPRRLRQIAVVGLLVSVLGIAAWRIAWVPFVNVHDPRWLGSHSDAEICAELARVQPIWGWTHDTSLLVGSCGPEWVGRILDDTLDADSLETKCAHLGASLRLLTGQAIGERDLEAWRTWYAQHRHESQQEWFRAAFADVGIVLPAVLTSQDVRALLQWMGEKHEEPEPPAHAAFVLLRHQEAMRDIYLRGPDSPMTPAEVVGFRRFVLWQADRSGGDPPIIATPRGRLLPPCGLALLALVSSVLLGWSLGRSTR